MLPLGPQLKAMSVAVTRATDELASEVTPVAQNSVTAWADVAGSTIDTEYLASIAYTCVAATHTICWKVLGANAADFSDVQEVQASADLAAGAIGSYSTSVAVWRYYKVQIQDKVGGTHGTATVRGIAKAG